MGLTSLEIQFHQMLHFKPYFFIKVNDDCSVKEKNEILRKIKEDMKPFIADGILSATILKRKEFYGFTNKKGLYIH